MVYLCQMVSFWGVGNMSYNCVYLHRKVLNIQHIVVHKLYDQKTLERYVFDRGWSIADRQICCGASLAKGLGDANLADPPPSLLDYLYPPASTQHSDHDSGRQTNLISRIPIHTWRKEVGLVLSLTF